MVVFDSVNAILDAVIIALAVVLLYVLFRKKGREFESKSLNIKKLKKDKGLETVRSRALAKLNSLIDTRGKLQRMISDAKRKYMKGEMTYEAMMLVSEENSRKILEIDEALSDYEGFY